MQQKTIDKQIEEKFFSIVNSVKDLIKLCQSSQKYKNLAMLLQGRIDLVNKETSKE